MTPSRIAILVLVAIAICFAAGVGLGFRGDSGTSGVDWVATLDRAFTRRVALDSLQGPCAQSGAKELVVQRSATCELSIAPTSSTRKLELRLSAGAKLDASYAAPAAHEPTPGGDSLASQTATVEAGTSLSFVIPKEGGTLSVECASAGDAPCTLVVP